MSEKCEVFLHLKVLLSEFFLALHDSSISDKVFTARFSSQNYTETLILQLSEQKLQRLLWKVFLGHICNLVKPLPS